ncbi:sugar nucleotide-binding protein [Bacillus sp. M6-12]|uniref:sugar nucleotide-binding protein n=1 Tax=Bacillus sp. M6-12 TaxID=2054166 RepID=UPI002155800D|nr:sugar nucleotide-binding protein [Bacillus sp. M6-12]
MLILGSSGLAGKALIEQFEHDFEVFGSYVSSPVDLPENNRFSLGVHEIKLLREIISKVAPAIIVSCLRGDFNQQLAFHKQLAMELQNTDTKVYYLSSVNVFDGDYKKHHSEMDLPVHESSYGRFKTECENLLNEILGETSIIIRIPQVCGKSSPRLMSLIKSIERNDTISCYSNLECNNISDTLLAKQLHYIIQHDKRGIIHLGTIDMSAHSNFIEQLLSRLNISNPKIEYKLYNNTRSTQYFGLVSSRGIIPDSLQRTNEDVISELLD